MTKAQLKTADDDEALEYTHARIYAYLHALQPLSGCCMSEGYQRGRELIAILAETSEGYDPPKRKLSLDECAEVLAFMHWSEPRSRATFYKEPNDKPSIECGFHMVLSAVEDAIRGRRAPKAA
jgi:hypothetical protein